LKDNINPDHYKSKSKETIERLQDNLTQGEFKGYLKGNILKYLDRYEHKNGVEDLMDYTCNKLGVKVGEPTADGLFEVRGVECLGACGYAPMMQLGDFYQEHLTEAKIDQLIADCKDGKITLHDK
jgi:hypothetical protein